jgi:hypothetical protein
MSNGSYQRMIEPVTTMIGIIPATNAALAFCPALNLPTSSAASRPRDHSQRRSARVHRLRRRTSARRPARHRPAYASTKGTGMTRPARTWVSLTSVRRPTSAVSGPT